MNKLLTLTLILIFTLTTFISLSMWVGRQLPLPDDIAVLRFDLCELPCWIGITPGQTSSAEAKRRINDLFNRSPYQIVHDFEGRYTIKIKSLNVIFTLQLIIEHAIVNMVVLNFDSVLDNFDRWQDNPYRNRLTLGDLHLMLGTPRIVSGGYCIFHYGKQADNVVVICNTTNRFSMNERASVLLLRQPDPASPQRTLLQPWRGFASPYKYGMKP